MTLPEPDVYCVEEGCPNHATTERLDSITTNGDLIVELVCDRHARKPWWQRLIGGRK